MKKPSKEKFDDITGKICKALVPVRPAIFAGNAKDTAICTLASMGLLKKISRSEVMDRVAIAGRLLSENKGIDAIIQFALDHPDLKHIVLCGKEVKGHLAGQALLSLHKNGIDKDGRIIGAIGPYPKVESTNENVGSFKRQVRITDMIGTTDIIKILLLVS